MLLLRPLAKQEVFFSDSTLAPYDYHYGTGLTVSYGSLIRKAFHEKWWGANSRNKDGYTQMEANFSLYWGIALLMYQRTLISDDTPLDPLPCGGPNRPQPSATGRLGHFPTRLQHLPLGPETTAAAVGEIVQADGTKNGDYHVCVDRTLTVPPSMIGATTTRVFKRRTTILAQAIKTTLASSR